MLCITDLCKLYVTRIYDNITHFAGRLNLGGNRELILQLMPSREPSGFQPPGPLFRRVLSDMFLAITLSLLSLLPTGYGQTLYLAGDSTMALGGGGSETQGWGVPLSQYLIIPVVNDGVAGESARSYSDHGRFANLVNTAKKRDFVIIEFGHNDVSVGAVDNGKQDAVGDGYNITSTVTAAKCTFLWTGIVNFLTGLYHLSGTQILIHSFAFYIENLVASLLVLRRHPDYILLNTR